MIPCGQMVLWYARVVREQSVSQVICICHTLWIDGTVVCQSGQRIVCLPGYMYMSYLVDRWYCGMLEWSENSLSPRLYLYVIPCGQMVLRYVRVVREQPVSQVICICIQMVLWYRVVREQWVICICHTLWIDGTVVCQSGQRIVCLPGYIYMPYLVERWYRWYCLPGYMYMSYLGMLEWSENSLSLSRLYVYVIPCGQMVLWYARVVREQPVSQVICICHTLWYRWS